MIPIKNENIYRTLFILMIATIIIAIAASFGSCLCEGPQDTVCINNCENRLIITSYITGILLSMLIFSLLLMIIINYNKKKEKEKNKKWHLI